MRDVLETLREALRRGEKVDLNAKYVVIGDVQVPRKTLTNFRSNLGNGPPYALDAIYVQYAYRDQKFREFVATCEREGVEYVKIRDKQNLLNYLEGKTEQCVNVKKDEEAGKLHRSTERDRGETFHERGKDRISGIKREAQVIYPTRPRIKKRIKHETQPVGSLLGADVKKELGSLFERVSSLEIHQRSRDSVMAVPGRDFSWLRTKLDDQMRARKARAQKPVQTTSSAGDGPAAAFDPRGDRYKVKEDRVWRETMGADFDELGINPSGSFIKPQTNAPTKSSHSSNASEGSSGRAGNIAESRRIRPQELTRTVPRKQRKLLPNERVPIIVVPVPSRGVIVNAANLQGLIENNRFLSLQTMQAAGIRPSTKPLISARRDPGGNARGAPAEYCIASNVTRLRDSDWNRVVAVICSGQDWQFKTWPHRGGLPEIFRNVQGFYFHYDDEPPSPKVKDWAVKKLELSRNRRHMDSRVMTEFWTAVDKLIASKKPYLHY